MSELNKFDRIARIYDSLACLVFGKAWRNAQTCFLNQIEQESKILILGGGTGFWIPELMERNPRCKIWYVEASEVMILKAQKHARDQSRISFIHSDEMPNVDFQFDVVVTFFFLDMFEERSLKHRCELILKALRHGGRWLVADFVSKNWWQESILVFMYLFFRGIGALSVRKLPDWEMILTTSNLRRVTQRFGWSGFIRSAIFEKLGS
jgi:tRNA (cmo5U34)-methyltransferase